MTAMAEKKSWLRTTAVAFEQGVAASYPACSLLSAA